MNETPPEPFSWGPCAVAFLVTIVGGGILNVVAGFGALAVANQPLGAVMGALPGVVFALIATRTRRNGFSQGMLAAACLIGLVGGLCGYGLGAGLNIR